MKKATLIAFGLLIASFIAIQFIRPDFSNPPVEISERLESAIAVPPEVEAILRRSCTDCHSNETVYPWYSKIQPAAWFLADHITEGRRELNFSKFGTYEPRRKRKKLEEICEQVKFQEMPLPSYLWIHRAAALDDAQIRTVCGWTEAARASLGE